MKLSLRRIGNENMYYQESDKESDVTLVFISGGLTPKVWKHQYKYFSKRFKTVVYQPTVSFRDYEGEKSALKEVIQKSDLENIVLISHVFGNSLAQEFESMDKVVSTVLTCPVRRFKRKIPRRIFDTGWKVSKLNPKIAAKLSFGKDYRYTVVKDFLDTLEKPDYLDFISFIDNHIVRRPSKDSLVLHSKDSRFSTLDFCKELKPNVSVSILESVGDFPFFEKPQDYNKALIDFLNDIERNIADEDLVEKKESHHSLKKFEKKSETSLMDFDEEKDEDHNKSVKKIKV